MGVIRWEPVAELGTIQNEMNRLFNSFLAQPGSGRSDGSSRQWIPAMDLVETGDHYVLRADLPGLSEEDFNVQFEDSVLTISGERKLTGKPQKGGYLRIERAFGQFSRSLTLPEGIDPDAIQASFEHGVLEITIPKPEQKKPRRVQINVGDSVGELHGGGSETDAAPDVEMHTDTREPVAV